VSTGERQAKGKYDKEDTVTQLASWKARLAQLVTDCLAVLCCSCTADLCLF
jgi:hypothetical protein